MTEPQICERCPGTMSYAGRISLPPQKIYKCERCGHQKWMAEPSYQPQVTPVEPPHVQQQQIQPKKDE